VIHSRQRTLFKLRSAFAKLQCADGASLRRATSCVIAEADASGLCAAVALRQCWGCSLHLTRLNLRSARPYGNTNLGIEVNSRRFATFRVLAEVDVVPARRGVFYRAETEHYNNRIYHISTSGCGWGRERRLQAKLWTVLSTASISQTQPGGARAAQLHCILPHTRKLVYEV
jgi:hypothetical protein